MRRSFLAVLFFASLAMPALASEPVRQSIPGAQLVGEGRLTFAFWDVYDAALYAPQGTLRDDAPHALTIRYLREIAGVKIADRSVQEIRSLGFADEEKLARWQVQMEKIFPDVKEGTVLTAIFIPEQKTIFYSGNSKIGEVRDAEFTQWFAAIWLDENTSEPALRAKLLGLS